MGQGSDQNGPNSIHLGEIREVACVLTAARLMSPAQEMLAPFVVLVAAEGRSYPVFSPVWQVSEAQGNYPPPGVTLVFCYSIGFGPPI